MIDFSNGDFVTNKWHANLSPHQSLVWRGSARYAGPDAFSKFKNFKFGVLKNITSMISVFCFLLFCGITDAGSSLLKKAAIPSSNLNCICAPTQDSALKLLFEKFNLGEIQADYPITLNVEKSITLPEGKLDVVSLSSEFYFPPGLKPFFFLLEI